jgi:hypothetical protein
MRVRPPSRGEVWWRDQPAPLPVVAAAPVVNDVSAPESSAPVPVPLQGSGPVDSAPVVIIEVAPPVDSAGIDAGASSSGAIAVEIAADAELSGDVSSSGELPAIDDDVSSSGSHPAVGSNGQPKAGRSKRKSGSRKKRNTR